MAGLTHTIFQRSFIDEWPDDMLDKGRQRKGERKPNSKLTDERVREFLEGYVPFSRTHGLSAYARKFGVHPSALSHIVTGRQWRHLT